LLASLVIFFRKENTEMTVTLELTEDQERRVLDSAERHDEAGVREVLTQALEETVTKLMQLPAPKPQEVDFETLSDELAKAFTASPGHRPLPAAALTREGIYGDHP